MYDQSGDLLKSSSTLGTVKKELLPTQSAYPLLFINDQWSAVFADTLLAGATHSVRYLSLDGSVLLERDLTAHFIDTTVNVRVFSPDPLTPYNLTYGGVYTDLNDANGGVLDSLTIIGFKRLTLTLSLLRLLLRPLVRQRLPNLEPKPKLSALTATVGHLVRRPLRFLRRSFSMLR